MPRWLFRYGTSLAALLVAVVARWLLDPVLGDSVPFITLFGAVAVAVWIGGIGPAVLVAALGYLACAYLFFQPRYELLTGGVEDVVALGAFVFTCALIIGFCQAMRRARRRAEIEHETLRVTFASMGDAVICTDADGRISSMNPVAEALTGWPRTEAAGQPLEVVFRIVDGETREPMADPTRQAIGSAAVVHLTNHAVLLKRDGTECPIDDSAAPMRDAEGQVVGCVLTFRDVTRRRNLEAQLAERLSASHLLSSIIESSQDAIVSKTLDGTIRSWNAAAERMFGYTSEEAVGQHISLLIPPDRLSEEDEIIARLRTGARVEHFDTVRLRKHGEPLHVSLTISPIRDDTGRIVGASKIVRDISDRVRVEAELRLRNERLREADQRKDEFLATLAHELRNPLAPLANALEIMRRADQDPATLQQAREAMDRQLPQIVRLVDDLLDVSRIGRGKVVLRRATVPLATVLHDAVEMCRPIADAAGVTLDVTLPASPIFLDADSLRLTQVFSNLLNNACKYTPPGGRVRVRAEAEGAQARVSVKDTGTGIAADKLGGIFEMFAQVDATPEQSQGGLGIGLTLARRLTELHGGTIEARSEGLGCGSEFVVRLPTVADRPAAVGPAPAKALEPGPARRVLVVDDNLDSAASLDMLLRIDGHETLVAHDGPEAIAATERFRPDVVLLDIGLPGLSGYDACRLIREQSWGRNIILVAVTGWGDERDRGRARDAGFDYHLVKPIDFAALGAVLAASRPGAVAAAEPADIATASGD